MTHPEDRPQTPDRAIKRENPELFREQNRLYQNWYRKNKPTEYSKYQKEYRKALKDSFIVYALVNKHNNKVEYIGYTNQGLTIRLQNHLAQYKYDCKDYDDIDTSNNKGFETSVAFYKEICERGLSIKDFVIREIISVDDKQTALKAEKSCQNLMSRIYES